MSGLSDSIRKVIGINGIRSFCVGQYEAELIDVFGSDYDQKRRVLFYEGHYYRVAVGNANGKDGVVIDAWAMLDEEFESQGFPVEFASNIAPCCPVCRSGEYLHNEDGNQNSFCGQCGTKLDWSRMKNIDTGKIVQQQEDTRCHKCASWMRCEDAKSHGWGECTQKKQKKRANQKACKRFKTRVTTL